MSLLFCEVFAPDWWFDISQLEERAELDWGERKMGGRSLDTLGSNSPLRWEGFSIYPTLTTLAGGGVEGSLLVDPPTHRHQGSSQCHCKLPVDWGGGSICYSANYNQEEIWKCDSCKRWKLRRSLDCGCSSLTFHCWKHQKIVRNKYIDDLLIIKAF